MEQLDERPGLILQAFRLPRVVAVDIRAVHSSPGSSVRWGRHSPRAATGQTTAGDPG